MPWLRIWRAGCIGRAAFSAGITRFLHEADPDILPRCCLAAEPFCDAARCTRAASCQAALNVPIPCSPRLAYFEPDARRACLALIQGRKLLRLHTYRRVDKEGVSFYTLWRSNGRPGTWSC